MYRGKTNTLEFIGEKLKGCLLNHVHCPGTAEQPLPHRLIDVGRPGGDEDHQPRLYITAKTELRRGIYAALSYCWGRTPFLTLTQETVEALQQQIPLEQLPPTLRDAIEITRGLGIRYLWVDALCILQGQSVAAKDDWARESAQMDSIYSHALVVLGVASASNAYEGIGRSPYQYGNIVEVRPLREAMATDDDTGLRRCFIASPATQTENILGPLHTRGWTFQERILAKRFVHLGKEKMFFECDHGIQYEHYTEEPFRLQLCKRLDPTLPRFDSWYKFVEEYSSRELTEPTDSLIALSGVAKYFARMIGTVEKPSEYLAGLWKENLVCDLLWCVKSPSVRIDVAPSWSWAARRFEVSYERIRRHACNPMCATIISTNVTDFPAPYGFRSSGQIIVEGYLRKIFLHGEQNRYHIVGFQGPRSPSESQDAQHRIGMCLMDFPNAEPSLDRANYDCLPGWENMFQTWCIQLHSGRGLLLQPTGKEENEYERIGYYEFREQPLRGDVMSREEWASNRNPIAQAAYLAEHPFCWIQTAMEVGLDELVDNWFGDPSSKITLV